MKIATIITTMARPELLQKTIKSIIQYTPEMPIIVVDQSHEEGKVENRKVIDSFLTSRMYYVTAPTNCGISVARNMGVEEAERQEFDYVIMSADSIEFMESMNIVENLASAVMKHSELNIDILGFDLKNRKFGWEAFMTLIEGKHFQLEFIDKKFEEADFIIANENIWHLNPRLAFYIYKCDIVRNFFLGSVKALKDVRWDDNLKMREHEDFFWRFKQRGYKVGWTAGCSGNYIGEQSKRVGIYGNTRQLNWNKSFAVLKQKYGISGWVDYVNLERAKE